MMKQLGARMYRFSVDWSRCEPEEGEWDDAALARYVRWCKLLREAGIEPMVTLHHFNEPTWFDEKGGWEVRANVETNFGRFAERVAAALAPHCGHWATINELNGYAVTSWVAGVHPPGKTDPLVMLRVVRHLLVAHTIGSRAIRAASAALPTPPTVCLPLSTIWVVAGSWWNPLSFVVATVVNLAFNFAINDALQYGHFCRFPLPLGPLALLCGWGRDVRALKARSAPPVC